MPGYDYSRQGAYFITICTRERELWLGETIEHEVMLSASGRIATTTWSSLPDRFVEIALDAFVIMPNHVHGILVIKGSEFIAPATTSSDSSRTPNLGEIVRTFKAASTSLIRGAGDTGFAWQSNYYEHIIRNEAEMLRIRAYIQADPSNWKEDPENPGFTAVRSGYQPGRPWAR